MAKSKNGAEAGPRTNKSEAVRGVLSQTPHATSKEIIAVLAEKGIKVSPTMVYYVRSKQKQATRRAKRERVAESSRLSGAQNPVEIVIRVKNLSREVGGIKYLKQLVDLLAE